MYLSDKDMQWSNKNNDFFYLKIELRYIEQNVKHQYSQLYRHKWRIGSSVKYESVKWIDIQS